MNAFSVIVTPVVTEKIDEYASHIAEQSGSVEIAERWIDRVYDAVETLSMFPRRFGLAEEDAHREYEIRRLIIGDYLAAYTIDDAKKTVMVVGFRHGARLPQPEDSPEDAD